MNQIQDDYAWILPEGDPAPFTFQYYRLILEQAMATGYHISSFIRHDANNQRTIIMRHDVDYTVNGIIELAEIEYRLGLTATYLFRVHASDYNLMAPHVLRLVHIIKDMGHEIGLHFEAMTVSRALGLDPIKVLLKEKRILEDIAEVPIITASEHRDVGHVVHGTPYFHDKYDPTDFGIINYAMDSKYTKDMKYLSDSNGIWREGDLGKNLGLYQRFHVLVHADWWSERDLLLKGPYIHGRGNGVD